MDKDKAKELAYYTELPDTEILTAEAIIQYTWADGEEQKRTHALTNEPHKLAEEFTRKQLLDPELTDIKEIGRLLHRYGDTYAHTRLEYFNPLGKMIENAAKMRDSLLLYGKPLEEEDWWGKVKGEMAKLFKQKNPPCTVDHQHSDGLGPDYIRTRPRWYLKYVKNVAEIIKKKFGLDGQVDMNLFNILAAYAKGHGISLIGIIDYEIAKYLYVLYGENKEAFSFAIKFARTTNIAGQLTVESEENYRKYVENTKIYLDSKNIKYTTKRYPNDFINSERLKKKTKEKSTIFKIFPK